MPISHIKINGIANPLGYEPGPLLLSWHTDSVASDQQNAKVSVFDGAKQLVWSTEGNLSWEGTPLSFEPLPRTHYTVQVEVTDTDGVLHSGETWFETGKLGESWRAQWIGVEGQPDWAPVFTKSFSAQGEVASARLYMVGLGVYSAELNGLSFTDEILAPGLWFYEEETQYQTYDVTRFISAENKLEVTLGNGWYKGRFGLEREPYSDQYGLLIELHITFADGTTQVVFSDESWQWYGSDIDNRNGIYDGETLDRLSHSEKENSLLHVVPVDLGLRVVDRFSPPVKEVLSLPVAAIIHTPAGETVLDFGQNHTGLLRFHAALPCGTEVRFEFGEILQQGNFYNENYRGALHGFVYRSDGREEIVCQKFTFYGFRYVRVTGWPGELNAADFVSPVVHTELDRTGWLTSGHEKLNRLYENVIWGQRSNFLSVPTDCPQRDERLGWTGDAQVFAPTACYNMDCRAFYRSFLRLLRLDQLKNDGTICTVYPRSHGFISCSIWSDACTLIPQTMHRFSGSIDEIAAWYPMMKDWVDYVWSRHPNFLYEEDQLGDWLALDGVTDQSFKGGTDDIYLGSVYWMNSARITADLAEALGLSEDAATYRQLADNIRSAVMDTYFTPTGRLSVDTQAGYITALKFGLWRNKEVLLNQFMRRMRFDGFEIRCGFAGAPLMCTVLAEHGMGDLSCDLLLRRGFPGWLYAVDLGATTVWERWNSVLPDGTISGTGMNSLNHYAYGSVMEYVYGYLAGIRPGIHGFRNAVIAPQPDIRIGHVECTLDTISGHFVSNWAICKDGKVSVHIEVPFSCSATVTLPRSGTDPFTVGTGSYDYEYTPTQDYRALYTLDTRLSALADDNAAKAILLEDAPPLFGMIMGNNREFTTQTFRELSNAFFLGLNPEKIEHLVGRLSQLRA